jgi:hypothetical protein
MRSFSRAAALLPPSSEEDNIDHANIRRNISLFMEQQISDEIIVSNLEVRLILIIFNLWLEFQKI